MNGETIFHSYGIEDIINQFTEKLLVIDDSYQRRSIWMLRDKIRLIETILNGYLIPPLYLWQAKSDANTGKKIKHIVDGQQRVKAIVEYIEGAYKLDPRYLTLDGKAEYIGKDFSDLSKTDKLKIWDYDLAAIDLKSTVTREQIGTIFTRLNLTEYSLNDQERRHSGKDGLFAQLAAKIARYDFWNDESLFTLGGLKRMKDVEFCASLLLMAREGIIDQTSQKALNDAYDDYKEDYPDAENDENTIVAWMEIVGSFITPKTRSFIKRKSQLYTMFCLADCIHSKNLEVTKKMIGKFEKYVDQYNRFKNDGENVGIDKKLLPIINKHKLAVSEGINKHKNRLIRYESMKVAVLDK